MNKLIIFILTLLPVLSYSQVTSINIDTSASQVIIINNGTMIENNQGTVNVGSESKSQDKSWKNDTRCNWYSDQSATTRTEKSIGDLILDWDAWSELDSTWDLIVMIISYIFVIILSVDLFPIICIWFSLHDYNACGDKLGKWFYISIIVIVLSLVPLVIGINSYLT